MAALPDAARLALDEILGRDDTTVVGVVLSGSAARGLATSRSDVDVYVVHAGPPESPEVLRSAVVDEIPISLAELETPPPYLAEGYWHRWSFAYAQVLRDGTDGRLGRALRRQATLTDRERDAVIDDRLDGFANFAYRSLKSHRDGRPRETRLDAAEALPWLLDVVFALAGRVRPYNKYLAWELREHPLAAAEWSADTFLPLLDGVLDGDPAAVRATFAVVEREVRRDDEARGRTTYGDVLDDWGDELALLRG